MGQLYTEYNQNDRTLSNYQIRYLTLSKFALQNTKVDDHPLYKRRVVYIKLNKIGQFSYISGQFHLLKINSTTDKLNGDQFSSETPGLRSTAENMPRFLPCSSTSSYELVPRRETIVHGV